MFGTKIRSDFSMQFVCLDQFCSGHVTKKANLIGYPVLSFSLNQWKPRGNVFVSLNKHINSYSLKENVYCAEFSNLYMSWTFVLVLKGLYKGLKVYM